MVKKRVKKSIKRKTQKAVRYTERKFNLIIRNLVLFAILFIISTVLYNIAGKEIYENLFLLLTIIFGFVAVAFLIVFLIFLFLRLRK